MCDLGAPQCPLRVLGPPSPTVPPGDPLLIHTLLITRQTPSASQFIPVPLSAALSLHVLGLLHMHQGSAIVQMGVCTSPRCCTCICTSPKRGTCFCTSLSIAQAFAQAPNFAQAFAQAPNFARASAHMFVQVPNVAQAFPPAPKLAQAFTQAPTFTHPLAEAPPLSNPLTPTQGRAGVGVDPGWDQLH